MSKFQIILLVMFGFFILAAVLTFSLYQSGSKSQYHVVIWGSFSQGQFSILLQDPLFTQDKTVSLEYVQKPAASIESDFTEALAQGNGPDLVILPQSELWQSRKKLSLIPFASISERDFRDTFFDGSDIFLSQNGIYALPLLVDPMVLYYNRDILSTNGIAKPLAYWDEVYVQSTQLTKKDDALNITQTTIALGGTKNIPHFKDIFSLLLLQAGTPIVQPEGFPKSLLSSAQGLPVAPGTSALDFYTQFVNPLKPFYDWNKNMPPAIDFFASGDSAYYLGFGSELPLVRSKSPTLNFALASVPQSRVSGKKITFGNVFGIALSKGSKNPSAALSIALNLVSSQAEKALSTSFNLPPARRDLLSAKPTDANGPLLYDSALQSHSWFDPDAQATSAIFTDAIESVTSGRARTSEALNKASEKLESLFNQ